MTITELLGSFQMAQAHVFDFSIAFPFNYLFGVALHWCLHHRVGRQQLHCLFSKKKWWWTVPSETHQQKHWQYMAIYGNMEFRKIGRFKWFVSCSISSFKTAGENPQLLPPTGPEGLAATPTATRRSVFNWSIGVTYKIRQTDLFFSGWEGITWSLQNWCIVC